MTDKLTDKVTAVLILVSGVGVFYVSLLLLATGDPAKGLWMVTGAFGGVMCGIGAKLIADARKA